MNETTYFGSSFTEEELFSSFLEEELAFTEELLTFAEDELFALTEEELFAFAEEELLALTEDEDFALDDELLALTTEELDGSSAGALEPESSPQAASIKPSAAVITRDL
jgi:hypothetical protein